ncbi:MAG: metal ABC transporter ATP-binding protein [Spirochaetales bacterium]|nr:metal ABC transporter ATP-binding protein [Spirochaetales bacterium]
MLNDQILVENVSYSYYKDPVIKNAHFHIEKGSFCSFIGPNGGGKTTMARLILGMLVPDSGYITIFGEAPKTARKRIGYVPQHSSHDPGFPIRTIDVVLMGRLVRPFGFYCRSDIAAAHKALEETEMDEFADESFVTLSGGQRQRVLISRALAGKPEILLLDEPTANVDAAMETKLYSLLKELNRSITIIMISHDLAFVSDYVDKVICIDKSVHIHPTNELNPDAVREIYGQAMRVVNHRTHIEETHD